MIADATRERLNHEPFQPFSLRTSGGKRYVVRNPGLAVMMKSEIFVASPNSDNFVVLPYLHIAGVEAKSNGNGDHKRGRRK